ncbi:MAG: hypothetical protein ACREDT_12125 [Methylocella sp.]
MRYSCAAVALMAAMAFSPIALGQTRTANTAFHVIKKPTRATAPASPPLAPTAPRCTATVCDQIDRYTDTAIIEATEYFSFPDGTCRFADQGKWSSPKDIQPLDNGTPAGTVTFSVNPDTPPPNQITGATCIGGGPYQYARLHFTWNLHKNKTADSFAHQGYDPTATFSSDWTGKFGSFFPETFQITVPVVRPKGEMSTFVNWLDSRGNWMPTLILPDKDPDFDFTGELIQEVTHKPSTCYGRGIGSMGSTGVVRNDYSVDSSWHIVNKVMFNQNDIVGWSPCGVEYYRCVKAALPACGYTGTQEMQIKSDADSGYTTYTTNNISATIEGWIIPFAPYKLGIGTVTSQRSNPAAPQPPQSKFFPSSENNCPTITTKNTTAAVLPCSAEPFAE